SQNGACPDGYQCKDVALAQTTEAPDAGAADAGAPLRQCVPVSGKCPGCVDRDGDGYGIGLDCLGPDCDDSDPTVHPGAPEICDGRDNNCDGRIDENFDFQRDDQNCGRCGNACDVLAGRHCCGGACVDTTTSRDHCGGCDHACTGPGAACCASTCHDTSAEAANCGGCGVACTNEHGAVA